MKREKKTGEKDGESRGRKTIEREIEIKRLVDREKGERDREERDGACKGENVKERSR